MYQQILLWDTMTWELCRDFRISKFLIGFIPATSGSARVNGYNIETDISSVRGSLGMCPQHNTLFDSLTVKEQLEFYYKVRRDLSQRWCVLPFWTKLISLKRKSYLNCFRCRKYPIYKYKSKCSLLNDSS